MPAWIRFVLACFIVSLLSVVPGSLSAQVAAPAGVGQIDLSNNFFAILMPGFFPGDGKMLKIYAVRRDGKWDAAVASSNNDKGRATWNTALYPVDISKLQVVGNKISGDVTVTLAPDPWVPLDQKARVATIKMDVTVTRSTDGKDSVNMDGTWSSTIDEAEATLKDARLFATASGKVNGGIGGVSLPDLSDESYNLAMPNLLPGESKDNFPRRKALSIGIKKGKVVSARLGAMDMRHSMYDFEDLDTPVDAVVTPEGHFRTKITFSTPTLDGTNADFRLELEGKRVANFVVGTWKGDYYLEGGQPIDRSGFFKANVVKGAYESTAAKDTRPWFVPTAGFKPVEKGEHPRLFFRKSDVPELRRRAATPEGQQIIKRLRQTLNGSDGETMPTRYNPAKVAYNGDKSKGGTGESWKSQVGDYTISHAAGYGFLYQLTGEVKYADLARQCVEKAWEGQRSGDDRYAWVAPGGELRAGPAIAMYAFAYDLCYDAWPEDFRKKVALALQNYSDEKGGEWNNPEGITLKRMVLTPRQGPGSNHYGAVIGGSGLVVLAIKGDPGIDDELLNKYLEVLEKQTIRHYMAGWGDGGYYKEGWGASRVGTQGGFLMFLQALKSCHGHDYLNVERTSTSYTSMVPRCLMVIGPPGSMPYRSNMGGTYGNPEVGALDQNGGGIYSEGLGAVADKYKPALLWTYNHQIDPQNKFVFDSASPYPHRPVMALINWPTFAGVQEKNPAEIMPLATRDTLYDYFVFRNRFQDKNDTVTTVLLKAPDGTKPREIMVWGLGKRLSLGEPGKGAVSQWQTAKDGSGTVVAGDWAIAVDHSKASGADVLIVSVSDAKAPPAGEGIQLKTVTIAGKKLSVLTLSEKGETPEIKVDGNKIIVGNQTVTYQDKKLQLDVFMPLK